MTGALAAAWRRARTHVEALQGDGIGAELARGALGSFAIRVGVAGVAFGLQLFLTRLLGADAFGTYVYALSWITFISQAGVLGFDTASLRFVAAHQAREEWDELRGFLRRSVQVAVLLSLALAALMAFVVWALRARLAPELLAPLAVASLLLPLVALLQVAVSQLQALRRVVTGQGVQGVLRPLLIAAVLGGMVLAGGARPTALTAILANAGATAVACGLGWLSLRRALPAAVHTARAVYRTRAWIATAVPLFLITAAQMLLSQTDVLMLGAMRNTTDAGVYAVASQLATLITFAIMAANTIVAPMIAALHAQGRRAELQRVLTLSARGVLAYAIPVVLVLLVAGRWILGLYGPAFVAGYLPLLVLAIGQVAIAVCGSVGFLLTMTGHEGVATRAIGLSALVNVVLNLALIPSLGLVGAAIATSIATTMRSLVLTRQVHRLLGYDATAFGIPHSSTEGRA